MKPVEREQGAALPLSFAQQRLWFLDQLEPDSAFYNVPTAVLLGHIDIPVLEQTLSEIVRRHEVLRTTFETIEAQAVQVVHEAEPVIVPLLDLSQLPESEREEQARRLAQLEAAEPFDLSRDQLFRVKLLRLAEDEHVLLLTMHHIISDGWSVGVLVDEVAALYEAFSAGRPSPLPELSIQYADYAVWQRAWLQGEVLGQQLSYWREHLEDAPTLDLPSDHPRPPVQTYKGATYSFTFGEIGEELQRLSQQEGVTLYMLLLAAFQVLLFRYCAQTDIVVGTPLAGRTRVETEPLIGFFINMLALRTDLGGEPSFSELLRRTRETALGAYAHQDVPFEKLVEELHPERDLSRTPLFQVMFVLQNAPMQMLNLSGLRLSPLEGNSSTAKYDLSLSMIEGSSKLSGSMQYNTDLFEAETIERMMGHFKTLLVSILENPRRRISELSLLTEAEREQTLLAWNATTLDYAREKCVHQFFEEYAAREPDRLALSFEGEQLTYGELNARANRLAHYLQELGVGPEVLVGLCVERSVEMVVGLLGILKAGGAYVPLDPAYPQERISFMLKDAAVSVLLTQEHLQERLPEHPARVICLDKDWPLISRAQTANCCSDVTAENLAYVIYTSGSTGRPKGVMVQHRNVSNFFTAMDERIGMEREGVWLALTSISFDISVLELFWTLARGFHVVLQAEHEGPRRRAQRRPRVSARPMEFSLFYFASNGTDSDTDRYRLLLDGARFADQHGFKAIWTPERHFHAFGDLYPNPAITSAALSTITERLEIRAGSVVSPLHHPVRVAEEWAMVDNLSKGRVGVSFASGWHAADFIFAPENYRDRKQVMLDQIETVRRLWRGETLSYVAGSGQEVPVRIFPAPVQSELPVWLTAAGNPETFETAGRLGCNLLTHLLGQSVEELAEKIAIYRRAWKEAGHGPGEGHVTLMLHTFVGEDIDEVKEKVREPFTNYLASSVDLIRNLMKSVGIDPAKGDLSDDDMQALLAYAFERYFQNSGLMGTPEVCLEMVERLKGIDVDEVACLIDFGVSYEAVMQSLSLLDEVRRRSNARAGTQAEGELPPDDYSIAAQTTRHQVTHLQCTPSLASMLETQPETRQSLSALGKLFLGGEALPASLVQRLQEVITCPLYNMYGPTETTVWSSVHTLDSSLMNQSRVPIGRPIANTQIYILDERFEPQPIGVKGELYIGGEGVVRGYLNRAGLTTDRFIPDPFSREPGARLYKTGDQALYLPDGTIEFLGRLDEQVKLRGYRIELGEIEAELNQHPAVRESVVVVRQDREGESRLVAYFVASQEDESAGLAVPSVNEIRNYLKERLPEYMIPSAFMLLDALPLTPNGKVNRRALPEPESAMTELLSEFRPPRTTTEEILAGVWRELLNIKQIGINDSFFELGGHSLLATQQVARIREVFAIEIALRTLFERPTIESLAEQIDLEVQRGNGVQSLPLKPVPRDTDLPLSFAQQRLWFLDQLDPGSAVYNTPSVVRLKGPLNITALTLTLTEIVRRHEVLRTTFAFKDGQAVQVIQEAQPVELPVVDLSTDAAREQEALRLANEHAQQSFDLAQGPLFLAKLVRLAEDDHVVLITMHHIVSDGWSTGVIAREIAAIYQAYIEHQPSPLPELPLQYADYAVWQREWLQGEVLEQYLSYWKQQLRGPLPVLQLPTDHPRPLIQSHRGAQHTFVLSQELSQAIADLSRQESATVFMTLLAAFNTVLYRYTGQADVIVGTPIANRRWTELENLIGFFANTLVLRTDLSGNPTFREFLGRVREVTMGAYAYQDVPFEKLVEELAPERDPSRTPLFQVLFSLMNAPLPDLNISGLTFSPVETEGRQAVFDIVVGMKQTAQELGGVVVYNADLFEHQTITRLLDHFRSVLEEVVLDPETRLIDIQILKGLEEEVDESMFSLISGLESEQFNL
jgi:natural product biosynthesis luciferase-like monooxygenase protein